MTAAAAYVSGSRPRTIDSHPGTAVVFRKRGIAADARPPRTVDADLHHARERLVKGDRDVESRMTVDQLPRAEFAQHDHNHCRLVERIAFAPTLELACTTTAATHARIDQDPERFG